jgi:hypothetical protein
MSGRTLAEVEVHSEHFQASLEYWGVFGESAEGDTRVYGFENVSAERDGSAEVPAQGTCFGFVASGAATVGDVHGEVRLREGQWFSMPAGCLISELDPDTRVVVSQKLGFQGLRSFGGPIERLGRLKYIDRCSDTLLAPPPLCGDPCLNHLHFPVGIEQTEHTHPSVRCGVVARGSGWCETPLGKSELVPGLAFLIPTGGLHRFVTEEQTMDVIAYHPDSDWGPTDEEHPMVNRTLVGGEKIDNTQGVHREAEVIGR